MYIVTLAGVAMSFALGNSVGAVQTVVAALAAVVLVSAALLFGLLGRLWVGRVGLVLAIAVTLWAVGSAALPMAAMAALWALLPMQRDGGMGEGLVSVCVVIACVSVALALIFWPEPMVVVSVALLFGLSAYALRLMGRLESAERSAEGNLGRAEELKGLLGSRKRMVRTAEHVSRLEERNRLAARIHDEIGHGMSGSILLLEGAELVMDKEPEKARETVRKVTENLRESVEEIRKVLREERSASAKVSLARIENELSAFEADHPQIKTLLETEGDMGRVDATVWTCVHENLVEALTNVLKHSAATAFSVSLKNSGALLRVEFADNGGGAEQGGVAGGFKERDETMAGIGLQSMEERAALCYGRCFFRHEPDGFHIVMTFPRRGQ